MDIFSHGLWTAAVYKTANLKRSGRGKRTLSLPLAAFWGVFPDFFAFTIPWIFIVINIIQGNINPANIPGPDSVEPPASDAFPSSIYVLASSLYNISHSAVVFSAVVFIILLVRKKIPWEMGGWLLHIALDIPTHVSTFFPTPVFWPLSGWKFSHGIAWHQPLFMIINYSAILITYIILYKRKSKNLPPEKHTNQ